jgi:hypothetical protein
VDVSPTDFQKDHEYEDDYCYGRLLHLIVNGQEHKASEVLTQFEAYLEGSVNGRFQVVQALLTKSQQAFDVSFDSLLQDRQNEIDRNIERGEIESPHVVAARRLFIEGLAILRLAESIGLKAEHEYVFCPSMARVPMVKPFPGE